MDTVRLNVKLDKALHRQAKMEAVKRSISLQALVVEALETLLRLKAQT